MADGFTQYPGAIDTISNLFFLSNTSVSELASAIGASDMSITVLDGTSFPSGVQLISIEDEIILCSSRSGNTFTVETRGFDSTTAAAHGASTEVSGNFTRHHFNNIVTAIIAIETLVTALAVTGSVPVSASNVTTITTVDSVATSAAKTIEWFIQATQVSDTTKLYSSVIHATTDGTNTNTNHDESNIIETNGAITGLLFNVDVSGGNIRLRASSTSAVNIKAVRRVIP